MNELGEEGQEEASQDSLEMDLGGSIDKEDASGIPRLVGTLDQWTTVSRRNRDVRERVGIEVTVDSGAVDTVGPPTVAPGIPIRETAASRSGMHYRAANNMKSPNLGEKKIEGINEEGQDVGMTIQVAKVNKVLASVGRMCEAGNKVVFDDEEGSYIMNKKTGKVTKFEKRNGVYNFNLMIPKELSSVESASNSSSSASVNPVVAVRYMYDALAESFRRQDDTW